MKAKCIGVKLEASKNLFDSLEDLLKVLKKGEKPYIEIKWNQDPINLVLSPIEILGSRLQVTWIYEETK